LSIYRELYGISPGDLAIELGKKRWTIWAIETGLRSPSGALLRKISDVTGISSDIILNWRKDGSSEPSFRGEIPLPSPSPAIPEAPAISGERQ
jgi:transcriptional regulator with XRE-family HTH domain